MNTDNAKSKLVNPVPGISNTALFRQQCLINGDWVSGASSLPVYNPATGRALGAVPNLGFSEAERAIDAAHKAFHAWKTAPAKDRAACLRRWYEAIMANASFRSISVERFKSHKQQTCVPIAGLTVLIGKNIQNLVPGVHGSTFGGNPLSCAAANAALDSEGNEAGVERAAAGSVAVIRIASRLCDLSVNR